VSEITELNQDVLKKPKAEVKKEKVNRGNV